MVVVDNSWEATKVYEFECFWRLSLVVVVDVDVVVVVVVVV